MGHTPRPWKVIDREVLEDGSVYPMCVVGGSRELQICEVESMSLTNLSYSDEMHESNGVICSKRSNFNLIAAAPQMLEALEAALPWVRRDGNREVIDQIAAAIAAAKGEA